MFDGEGHNELAHGPCAATGASKIKMWTTKTKPTTKAKAIEEQHQTGAAAKGLAKPHSHGQGATAVTNPAAEKAQRTGSCPHGAEEGEAQQDLVTTLNRQPSVAPSLPPDPTVEEHVEEVDLDVGDQQAEDEEAV